MEGDTKKNQILNTNASPSASSSTNPPVPNNHETSKANSVNFSSHDIGRTTIAHKDHAYFTNVKKSHKSLKQFFSQSPKEIFTKKRIIIIAIITLLLIGAIITAIFFLTHSSNSNSENSEESSSTSQADNQNNSESIDKQVEEYAEEIYKSTSNTSNDEVVNITEIRQQLNNISTNEDANEESKANAIIVLSESYYNESQFADAAAVIEESLVDNNYSPPIAYSLLSSLYNYYVSLNDREKQKNTLERMIQNLSQLDPQTYPIALSKDYYQSKLEELNNAQ